MYKNGDVCPICGSGKIKVEKKEEVFEYKGKKLSLCLTVYSCDECKEGFFDNKEMKKYQKTIKDFQRKVDGLLTSKQIKEIRKQYGLSQQELSCILGVAPKSIAKYEAGVVSQTKAMDNLLRVIKKFPEVLKYLKELNTESNEDINNVIDFKEIYNLKNFELYSETKYEEKEYKIEVA